MAKPDLDDGWVPLACELLSAVMCARIPHEARVVLTFIFLQTYGVAKCKVANLDAPALARMTGLKRSNVWRGISFLTENGVIEIQAGGGYKFVKDYERWGADVSLLGPALVSFSAMSPLLARSFTGVKEEPSKSEKTTQNPQIVQQKPPFQRINIDTLDKKVDLSGVSDSIRAEYPNGYAQSIQMDTRSPIAECIREEDTTTTTPASGPEAYPYQNHEATVLTPTPPGPPDPKLAPPYPVGDILDVRSGLHAIAEAEAREIFASLWLLSGRAKVCHTFYERQKAHAAATWREAIREAKRRQTAVRGIGIVELFCTDIETGQLASEGENANPTTGTPAVPRQSRPATPAPRSTLADRVSRAETAMKAWDKHPGE